MKEKDYIVIKLDKELDSSLQTVLPREFRGNRLAATRVNHVIRKFLHAHGPCEPQAESNRKTG